jgi:hypothetical protein
MRRLLVVGVSAMVVAGCGGSSEKVVSTRTTLATLRQAGFSNLVVYSNRKGFEQLARRLHDPNPKAYAARQALDQDTIVVKVDGHPRLLYGPLLVLRTDSVGTAKSHYAAYWSPKVVRDGIKLAQSLHLLPRGFDPTRLRSVRVCNLVLQTYNADGDPGLAARFDRAVGFLRRKC